MSASGLPQRIRYKTRFLSLIFTDYDHYDEPKIGVFHADQSRSLTLLFSLFHSHSLSLTHNDRPQKKSTTDTLKARRSITGNNCAQKVVKGGKKKKKKKKKKKRKKKLFTVNLTN